MFVHFSTATFSVHRMMTSISKIVSQIELFRFTTHCAQRTISLRVTRSPCRLYDEEFPNNAVRDIDWQAVSRDISPMGLL